jgi:hypothetical protein
MSGVTSSSRMGPRRFRSVWADLAVRCSSTCCRLLRRSLIHSMGGGRKIFSRLRRRASTSSQVLPQNEFGGQHATPRRELDRK